MVVGGGLGSLEYFEFGVKVKVPYVAFAFGTKDSRYLLSDLCTWFVAREEGG